MEKLCFPLPSGNICQIEHKPGNIWTYDQMQKAIEIFRERPTAEDRRQALDTIQYKPRMIPRILLSVSVFYLERDKSRQHLSHIPGQDWNTITVEIAKLYPDTYTAEEVKQATEEAATAYFLGY